MKKDKYYQIFKNVFSIIKKMLKKYGTSNFSVADKGSDDIVTSLDLAYEKYIIAQLNKYYPGVSIISEEFNSNIKNVKTYFTIDPIDGTVNFANNIPMYGVQIAYIEDNITKVAVIHMIPSNETYYAINGCGAYCNGKKISVCNKPANQSIVFVDGNKEEYFLGFVPFLHKDFLRVRVVGASCTEFSSIACGRAGGFLLIAKTPWDYTPGMLIVKEAGGYVDKLGDFIICGANKEILDKLLKLTKKKI